MPMRAVVVALAATGFLTSATWWRTSAQTAPPALTADPVQGSRNASTASLDGIVEGSDQKPIARARVVLRSQEHQGSRSSLGDSLTGGVHADGSFRIRGVMPGLHFIVLEGLSDPWTVTAVLFRGKNFLNQPVDIPSGGRIHGPRVIVSATSGASLGVPVTVLPKDIRKQDLIETHAAVLTRAIVR